MKKHLLLFFLSISLHSFGSAGNAIPVLNFKSDEAITLHESVWEFFYGKTFSDLKQDSNHVKGLLVKIPGNWVRLGFPANGYGTYRYRFTHNLDSVTQMAILIWTTGTNYVLHVNGRRIGMVGNFATQANLSEPNYYPRLFSFPAEKDTMELVFEVSNFHYRVGGFWFSPTLGKRIDVSSFFFREVFKESFLFGALIVLFFYFLAYSFINTRETTSLVFSFLCLSSAVRTVTTGTILLRQLKVNISWDWLVRLEFISLVLILAFGLWYIRCLFPKDVNRKITRIILLSQAILALVFLVFPAESTSHLIPYFIYYCLAFLAFLLYLIIQILWNKRPFAVRSTIAFIIIAYTGINDVIFSQAMGNSFYLLPFGIFIFALSQAIMLTQWFSRAFQKVESLSGELKLINANQVKIIEERTSLLNQQALELQQSNKIKDKVFSIISHDLKAPIHSLSTVLTWVSEDSLSPDELRKSLNNITRNVDTLNLTMENLLQWSRNQLNGLRNRPELIDIRFPIQDIIELYRIQINEKRINIQNEIQNSCYVFMDKYHLNLLLRNLISNAIKFSDPGGMVVIGCNKEGEGRTLIYIRDFGVGMTPEAITKVFSQEEHFTTYGTSNEKGTGLGLLLCKEYLDSENGKIYIDSEPGEGTTISFSLPNKSL